MRFDLKKSPNPEPVCWHGLSISAAQQGNPILGSFLSVGHLILLLLDIEEALAGAFSFTPMEDQLRSVLARVPMTHNLEGGLSYER